MIVALALAVITAFEVSLTYIDIGPLFLPLLIVLMLIKFFTVVLFFMHLRFDNKLYRRCSTPASAWPCSCTWWRCSPSTSSRL